MLGIFTVFFVIGVLDFGFLQRRLGRTQETSLCDSCGFIRDLGDIGCRAPRVTLLIGARSYEKSSVFERAASNSWCPP